MNDRLLEGQIDEDTEINYQGKIINLQDLSEETGIQLEILIHRGHRCLDVNYLTSETRSVPTYFFEGGYYTLDELAMLFDVNLSDLFDKMIKQGFSFQDALVVISKEDDERRLLSKL